jgi:hypothetical protein
MHKSVQAIDQSRLVMQVIGYRSLKPSEAVIVRILVSSQPGSAHSKGHPLLSIFKDILVFLISRREKDRKKLSDSIGC